MAGDFWYYANPSNPVVRDVMADWTNYIGMIVTPAQGNRIDTRFQICWDNSVFGKNNSYPGDDAFLALLDQHGQHRQRCAFAVAPDVVGDAGATLDRSALMLKRIHRAGYKPALAAQNGLEHLTVPWKDFKVLFLGGSPECVACSYVRPIHDRDQITCPHCWRPLKEWKEGFAAARLAGEAVLNGVDVHMGRANSFRRLLLADSIGCTSADGTYVRHGPDKNLPRLQNWLQRINHGLIRQEAS